MVSAVLLVTNFCSQNYVMTPYLSAGKSFESRKLISRFGCGCHGLHVDTDRLLPLAQQVPNEHRHCVKTFSVLLV